MARNTHGLRIPLAVAGPVVCLVGFCHPAIGRPAPYPVDRIPMRVEIDVGAQRYFVGESFPITVRIVNPNLYDVYLGGFEFGALEPHMEILFPGEEEFQDFSHGGTIDVIGGPPVLIPARGKIEHRRLVYSNTRLEGYCRFLGPGVYSLRMKSPPGAVTPGDPPRYTGVDWSLQVIEFSLTMPGGRDLAALQFLRKKVSELAEHQRQPPPGFRTSQFQLGFYPLLLERFPETVYAPEIRMNLAKLLPGEIASQHSPLYDDPEMVDLFEECLTFCFDKGGAYADHFLRLGSDGWARKARTAMELATKHKKFDLLKRIVKELDQKYPEDEAAILHRRVHVLAETESPEKARPVARTLVEKFPDSKQARRVYEYLEYIERKRSNE